MTRLPSYVVSSHCIAHRLASCGQAVNQIPYLKKFKDILDQPCRFYKKSLVRIAGFKEIQEVLDDPRLSLMQAKDVRWLPHEKAVNHLRKRFPSVLVSLEREAQERHNAEAAGLASFIKKRMSLLLLCTCFPMFYHPWHASLGPFRRKTLILQW